MTTSIACIREAETLVVATAGALTATVYVEDGLTGVVQIDHRRGKADELAEADPDHSRYFKRLWPLALRVIEAAVRDRPEAAEDVAGVLMDALGGPMGAMRWIGDMQPAEAR
ncbi:hypothetical protein [Sphingomonas sp.]|uniref:hypothetical protein n=1 Tax=Sphingomonas sp. TaxID=28214 RepID=UPI0035C86FF8